MSEIRDIQEPTEELTDTQLKALRAAIALEAENNRGAKMEELATALGVTAPAAHETVQRIVAKGWMAQAKPGGHTAYYVVWTEDRRLFDRRAAHREFIIGQAD